MSETSMKELKELYDVYSPLETNNKLRKYFSEITSKEVKHSNIRSLYNKKILDGFWNETVIKSKFIQKYSFNRSPSSTITIFELNAGSSRADLCMVNGKSMVFEIKTIYDSFNRLEKQLADYNKIFDYINIIIPLEFIENVLKIVPSHVGIITYRKNRLNNITFEEYKSPNLNSNLDSITQLSSLTKSYLTSLCKSLTLYEHNSKEKMIQAIMSHLSIDDINKIYKKYIKFKYASKWKFVHENRAQINPLDYQWFFKNPLPIEKVYR